MERTKVYNFPMHAHLWSFSIKNKSVNLHRIHQMVSWIFCNYEFVYLFFFFLATIWDKSRRSGLLTYRISTAKTKKFCINYLVFSHWLKQWKKHLIICKLVFPFEQTNSINEFFLNQINHHKSSLTLIPNLGL